MAINYSDLFPDESSISISYFYQLSIIQDLNLKETWKSIRVIIISICEHLNFFSSSRGFYAPFEITDHFATGLLRPFAYYECQKQV